MTTDDLSPSSSSAKKRRIMIITADESIIEQLQNSSNASLFKSIILDTNGDNVELSHSHIKTLETQTSTTSQTKKSKNDSLTCVVCGSAAHGYNFDAISCESCKAFFRRNALKDPATLECRRNNTCDVTTESRRRCSACRLTKCLKSGMKRDRLLTAEQKAAKRRKIEENRSLTLQTQETNSNPTTTNNNTQKSISEIIESKPQLSPTTNQTPSSKSTNLLLLNDVTDLLPQTTTTQDARTLLSAEELNRVEAVQLSFEQRIELAARDGLPWNPSVYADTFLQQINARSVTAIRLLSFFKQIPEFNELNVQDKVTLIKYNLMPLVLINYTLAYDPKIESVVEVDSDAPLDSSIFIEVHGQDLYARTKKVFESFVRIAQYDQRIIQLALIILILTKGFASKNNETEPVLDDGMAVYRAQNYYTELLWKYLETRHGYGKAAHIFNKLVAHFISWQTLQDSLQPSFHKALSSIEMNELLPIMKSLLHVS